MKDLLLRLIAHMLWADARTADAIEQTAAPVPDAERLFAHIAAAEHLWMSRIDRQPPQLAVWPDLSVRDARATAHQSAVAFSRLVSELDESALHMTVEYTNSAGRRFRNTIADIVTHVSTHGEHHRGQIARIVRAAGGEPPYTDFIQFARQDQ